MSHANSIKRNPRFIDRTGDIFGRLTVLMDSGKTCGTNVKWICRCECGVEVTVSGSGLNRGTSRSCGCLQRELLSDRKRTHGLSNSPEYLVWQSMIARCHNPNNESWKGYGGRGIIVHDEWRNSFAAFFAHIGPRPSSNHSIDRFPNNDGNYEPGNVRWATAKDQNRNQRRNRMLTHDGITLCMAAWEERLGLPKKTISSRLYHGWSIERALMTPPKNIKSHPQRLDSQNRESGEGDE